MHTKNPSPAASSWAIFFINAIIFGFAKSLCWIVAKEKCREFSGAQWKIRESAALTNGFFPLFKKKKPTFTAAKKQFEKKTMK